MNIPIHLVPCAGLANRILALVSGALFAKDKSTLRVLWKNEHNIYTGQFKDIFDVASLPEWVTVVEDIDVHSGWNQTITVNTEDELERYMQYMQDRRPYYIKSHGVFYGKGTPAWNQLLSSIRVIPEIANAGNLLVKGLLNVVGVHIRRTDNFKSIQESPSHLFWKKMAQYPLTTQFYVASDSEQERREACKQFPGRIILSKPPSGRNHPEDTWNAMLDLYCLSQTTEILGSYSSSFSEIAAAWGSIPLIVVRT